MAEARAARLAAVEARLNPPSTSASASAQSPDTSASGKTAAAEPPWKPTDKSDNEKKKEFMKLLYRGIVRDNGYKEASTCVDTLIKVSTNILQNPSEGKYRELKATNGTIKSRILDVKSGHDYLILLGFRTRTVAFEKQYILEPSLRRLHELRLGNEVLSEAADELRSRVSSISTSNTNHSADEAARRARALAEYEADRDIVKERVRREKVAREARERKAKEQAEAAARGEDQAETVAEGSISQDTEYGQGGRRLDSGDHVEDEDEEEEEEGEGLDEDERYARYVKRHGGQSWGQGHPLGGPSQSQE